VSTPITDARTQVVEELRDGDRFLLVTHENPDGDAVGSLVGLLGVLRSLDKDVVAFLDPADLPVPVEYRWLDLAGVRTEPPPDLADRLVVFLDCGNIDRTPPGAPRAGEARILNIDHHHDNTRFGDVNLVDDTASCTAEIVWELMGELGVEPTPAVADALYVGLVTDTGRFMYENTGPRAHLMAADLIAAGVDVHGVYRRLYEDQPPAKLALLGRALAAVQRFDGGALTLAHLSCEDFRATGADGSHSEGIIDHLRSLAGTRVAALARRRDERGDVKVSLRSVDGSVDVSAIARAGGGGGHRQAAGFSTEMSSPELVAFLREQIAAQSA
jgi:bifunctional oligoribonuclease and PAP phosphatase NrnA